MKVIPKALSSRNELNHRQGIKSSLPNMAQLIAGIITIYKLSPSSKFNYTEEFTENGKTAIKLIQDSEQSLLEFYENQLLTSSMNEDTFLEVFNESPLFKAQIEPLQVAIQLFWKLGEIDFVESMAASSERTGGQRYNKVLTFSTNLDIIENVLSNNNDEFEEKTKNLLFNLLTNKDLEISNVKNKLIKTLTVFSEETQFKIRDNQSSEIYFQQEGIYKELTNNNTVSNKDAVEDVGPFRILKSAVKDKLNAFLDSNNSEGFILNSMKTNLELENYLIRVNSYLNLNPKVTNIINNSESNETKEDLEHTFGLNKIFYGAPGTGKSYKVNELTKEKESRIERVTFHPEYDYMSFVGGYKPTMDDKDIRYEFIPQAFTNIYIKAWNSLSQGENEDFYLIIEEINRGNCAEIFGDIFQLLDRQSDYSISPSKELKEFLENKDKGLKNIEFGLKNGRLKLPSNLNILATMNTSDQSLFPMDSAFKRRWDWEYIPINYDRSEENKSSKFKVIISESEHFSWLEFIEKVNSKIKSNDNLGMDKCLGNYFIKPENDVIDLATFINKAIFYLWNDVFKDELEEESIFKDKMTYEDFFPIDPNGISMVKDILDVLKVDVKPSDE